MMSRAPISALERRSAASRAIWASCGGELLAGLDGALADALAGGQQLALGASCERLDPHRTEHLTRSAQLLPGVEAPAFTAEPFAIEEMRPGELHADPRASESFDRLSIEALSDIVVAEECA